MEPRLELGRLQPLAGLEPGLLDQKASSKPTRLLVRLQAYRKTYKRADEREFYSVMLVLAGPQSLGTKPQDT